MAELASRASGEKTTDGHEGSPDEAGGDGADEFVVRARAMMTATAPGGAHDGAPEEEEE